MPARRCSRRLASRDRAAARWLVALGVLVAAGCAVSSPVSRELGARCERQSDCDDRCLRADLGFPDGFCTATCDSDRDCPDGSLCAAREGGVCLLECRVAQDCEFLGAGWTCAMSAQLPEGEILVCAGE